MEDDEQKPAKTWSKAIELIEKFAERGPFRARDLLAKGGDPKAAPYAQWDAIPAVSLARGTWGYATTPRTVIASVRYPRTVACLYSALWLHGLVLREPDDAWVLTTHGGRPRTKDPQLPMQIVRTSHFPKDTELKLRRNVLTTSLSRTVLDFYRYRKRVGAHAPEAVHAIVLASGRITEEHIRAAVERSGIARRQLHPYRMPEGEPPIIVKPRVRAPNAEALWAELNRHNRDDWEDVVVRDWDGYIARLGRKHPREE